MWAGWKESVNLADMELFTLQASEYPIQISMKYQQVTGIVLAGGRSSRMGENKSLLRINGKAMIEYSIEALRPLCSEVVISSDYDVFGFTGCKAWPDKIPGQAPVIGIYSCLERSETEINIILTCDMPLVTTDLLHYLLHDSTGHDITVPVHGNGMMEPLCGIYKKSAAGILKTCIEAGNLGVYSCISKANNRQVIIDDRLPFFSHDLFMNINTPVDFEKVSSLLEHGNNL